MINLTPEHKICLLVIYLLVTLTGGCAKQPPLNSTDVSPSNIVPYTNPTITNAPPTPTSVPVVAVVNNENIFLSDFEAEINRFKQANQYSEHSDEEINQIALNNMIDMVLLSQAAFEAGYFVDDQAVNLAIDQLVSSLGSQSALDNWKSQYGFDEASFRRFLALSIAASWQRDQIAANVPTSAEQVLVQQILVFDEVTANTVLNKLGAGSDFSSLAFQYDPETSGNLGWFPRDFINLPEIEEAAFSLGEGEYSDIIQTAYGYHIILVLAHEENYPLSPGPRDALMHKALTEWLEIKRQNSEIIISLP